MTIALILGLAPLPKKTATGTRHHSEAKPILIPRPANSENRAAAGLRRSDIMRLLADSPMTKAELMDATGSTLDAVSKALHRMIGEGAVKSRMHKAENLYWAVT